MNSSTSMKFDFVNIELVKIPKQNPLKIKKADQEKVTAFTKKYGQKLPVITDDTFVILQGVQV